MSYRIRHFILVDYPIQQVHKAWLQGGSGAASLHPGPSYTPPGTGARVGFMFSLSCAIIASGFVQESRVQEHSRSPGGDQEAMGQGL